ncbi:MAG TPA: carbohydrate-binding family 9-like protein [Candidatus Acidoferrum sp.]|jgi:alpha-galactosidase
MTEHDRRSAEVVVRELRGELGAAGFPREESWELAVPVRFAADWQGRNEDAGRATEVRLLWTPEMLWLKFRCRYRILTVFEGSEANGRRDLLWDRDVAEVFLQTNPVQLRRYWEFEIAPNGMWIDLEISPEGKRDPESGMKSRVAIHESEKLWTAEVALPMRSLIDRFDPTADWRVNFFRVEGAKEPRFYSSWQTTHTAQPNFHVPEAFGRLRFRRT